MKKNATRIYSFCLAIIAVSLTSCSLFPCKKSVSIFSDVEGCNVTIHDNENEKKITLLKGINTNEDISHFPNGSFVIIESPRIYLVLQFGEYDHWFPKKHVIRINVFNDTITYHSGGLNIRLITESKDAFTKIQKQYYTN